jgi:hypothetical protein
MCKCTESKGFTGAISNASRLTKKTNINYGVYVIDNIAYLSLESEILKREDICCYYNYKGEKIDIVKVVEKKPKKKEVVKDEIVEN